MCIRVNRINRIFYQTDILGNNVGIAKNGCVMEPKFYEIKNNNTRKKKLTRSFSSTNSIRILIILFDFRNEISSIKYFRSIIYNFFISISNLTELR